MNNKPHHVLRTAAAVAFLTATACGDDHAKIDAGHADAAHIDAPKIDAPMIDAPMIDAAGSGSAKSFVQVEHLARPGINEALLITNDFLNGYNATAPSFAGVDPTTLGAVVGEAQTVLKAIYLGVCLTDGLAGLTADTGLKPAGMTCAAVGTAVFKADGVTLSDAAGSGAALYATTVFNQFEPDVMRIDTGIATSGYLNACGGSAVTPLLCGGRFIDDDVIDVTYYYLLGGLDPRVTLGSGATFNQLSALVSDGVQYSSDNSKNKFNATPSDPTNANQFHPDASQSFPYSAAPF